MRTLAYIRQTAADLWTGLSNFMKLVTALSAIIGLVTAGVTAYMAATGYFAERAAAQHYLTVAAEQLLKRNYALAWQMNEKAREKNPQSSAAVDQQAMIAMKWLEDMKLSSATGPKSFSEIAEPLENVLVGRAITAQGAERATLKAHIGWARFLRSRDGVSGLRIVEEYDEALQVDPQNMYAHLLRGFHTLWTGGPLNAARGDLDAALRSNVDPAFTDKMIIASLFNVRTDENLCGAIEYANKIRMLGRELTGAHSVADILSIYERGLANPRFLAQLSQTMPLDEHVATLDWILTGRFDEGRRPNAEVLKAYFLEILGSRVEAHQTYKRIIAEAPPFGSRAKSFAETRLRTIAR